MKKKNKIKTYTESIFRIRNQSFFLFSQLVIELYKNSINNRKTYHYLSTTPIHKTSNATQINIIIVRFLFSFGSKSYL